MSEKLPKRLVSKGKFVRTLLDKTILFSVGSLVLAIGLLLVAISAFVLLTLSTDGRIACIALVTGAVGIVALRSSMRLLVEGKEIEPVRPLTVYNQHQLPPEESLVRASDAPPSQQAELLRAAQYGKETPAEELLRAATTDGHDT